MQTPLLGEHATWDGLVETRLRKRNCRGAKPRLSPWPRTALSAHARRGPASQTHALEGHTGRTGKQFVACSKWSLDEFRTTGAGDFHTRSKLQDGSEPRSPRSAWALGVEGTDSWPGRQRQRHLQLLASDRGLTTFKWWYRKHLSGRERRKACG